MEDAKEVQIDEKNEVAPEPDVKKTDKEPEGEESDET